MLQSLKNFIFAGLRRQLGMPYPPQYQQNFLHLYADIFWWGMLNGSIIIFLAVYASRLGASTFQIGLLTAVPALVNLAVALPAGGMAAKRSVYRITPRAHLVHRLFYLLLIPLPVLLGPQTQIWVIIGIVFVMSIPGTVAAVIGNAFFAEVVPPEWRGQVVGIRNALLAVSSMIATFAVGRILDWLPFEIGYMVVFAIGCIGALLSAWQLFQIKPIAAPQVKDAAQQPANDAQNKAASLPQAIHPAQPAPRRTGMLRLDIFTTPFGRVLWVLFFFHVAVYLPGPLFPLYQVNILKFTDQTISLGTGLFWIVHFVGSTQTGRLAARLGFKRLLGVGTLIVSFATLSFAYSFQPWVYVLTQLLSGTGWSMVGGALINYVFDRVPADDRPPYMAWFNIVVNAGVLITGLAAPLVANTIGLFESMILAIFLRLISAWVVLKWG